MTRDEHIAKAEELLAGPWHPYEYELRHQGGWHEKPSPEAVAQAQAHATLALAMTQADRSTGADPVEIRPAVPR